MVTQKTACHHKKNNKIHPAASGRLQEAARPQVMPHIHLI
jgi:hypothetical protein